jgi:hypothetical protein
MAQEWWYLIQELQTRLSVKVKLVRTVTKLLLCFDITIVRSYEGNYLGFLDVQMMIGGVTETTAEDPT